MTQTASYFGLFVVLGFPMCCSQSAIAQANADDVILIFGGDVLLSEHYEAAANDERTLGFRNLRCLRDADVAMVNLESPVTMRGEKIEKPYNFRMHPRFLSDITAAGIDIVNLANNHIYDYDSTGLYDTIHYLDSAEILHVGAGRNELEAHKPVVLAIRGMRFAFFGYYGGGEAPEAKGSRPGVAKRALDLIARDITRAREEELAEVVVVNLHWGVEKEQIPEPDQVAFAHRIVDDGADIVIGHHPHVLQGIEEYRGKVIAYSLGNLLFGGNSRDTYDTALLRVRVGRNNLAYTLIPVKVEAWIASVIDGPRGEELVRMVSSLPLHHADTIGNGK